MDSQKSTLLVIDDGKGLRKAITQVFGKRAVVQRCQIHKMRNVLGHLPKELEPSVRKTMRDAYRSKTYRTALASLKRLVSSLKEEHPGASASLREGLEETLTIKNVKLSRLLERRLCSTNIIENLNASIRQVTRRVKTCAGSPQRSSTPKRSFDVYTGTKEYRNWCSTLRPATSNSTTLLTRKKWQRKKNRAATES